MLKINLNIIMLSYNLKDEMHRKNYINCLLLVKLQKYLLKKKYIYCIIMEIKWRLF